MKRQNKRLIAKIAVIFICIALLAFVDLIVVEKVYKPLLDRFDIPWEAIEITLNLFGNQVVMLWWNLALLILGITFFILLAFAFSDWKVGVAGILLFSTGWEDIMYYVIQLQPLPTELVWLDASPIITLSRLVTNSQHITNTGLVLTAFFGLAACIFLFSLFSKKTKS